MKGSIGGSTHLVGVRGSKPITKKQWDFLNRLLDGPEFNVITSRGLTSKQASYLIKDLLARKRVRNGTKNLTTPNLS